MYVIICKGKNSTPIISMFDDDIDALNNIKHLAENGATNITLAKEIEFEIERKVNVRLV
ncbi:hypothetical protein [Bacillus sp. JJ722]|uniref:hypothetical protein n=1 Tax=Bacillus sp. JJ722 TaxID=3122973 RepID=UPI0030004248